MLIRICENLHVAASEVGAVETVTGSSTDYVRITTKQGEQHRAPCDYGKSVWATADRIINAVNAALTPKEPSQC